MRILLAKFAGQAVGSGGGVARKAITIVARSAARPCVRDNDLCYVISIVPVHKG
jgi:hypothetical protein